MAVVGSAGISQQEAPLSYELLLQKTHRGDAADADSTNGSADEVSTVEPTSSASSADGDDLPVVPRRESVTLLRNVPVHGAQDAARFAELVDKTRALSESVFDENCLQEITKKSGWKLSLLVSDDYQTLCGFIVAKITKGTLSIAKLAVPAEFRGAGFGRLIMEEMIKSAKKQGGVYEVSLSSLPAAVTFYQRLGFKAFKNMKLGEQEELIEGQVYMEKRLGKRPRK